MFGVFIDEKCFGFTKICSFEFKIVKTFAQILSQLRFC